MAIRYLSGINVDSNTLFVDSANNRVGIGTGSPGYRLQVNGDAAFFSAAGSLNSIITQGSEGKGRFYLYDGGNATIALQTNGPSYFNAGNVLIGTTTDNGSTLNVNGSGFFSSNLQTNSVLTIGNQSGAGNYILQITPSTTVPVALQGILAGTGAAPISMQASGGNVLIGTTTDAGYKLAVAGSTIIGGTSVSIVNLYLTRTAGGIAADANYFVSGNNTPNHTWIEGGYYTGELAGVVTAPNSGYPYFEAYSGQGSATAKSFGFVNKTSGSFISTDFLYTMGLLRTGQIRFNQYGSGSFTGTATYGLAVDSSGNIIEVTSAIDGSGTANYVTKWQDANTLTNSVIYDNGTNVGIGTTAPVGILHLYKAAAAARLAIDGDAGQNRLISYRTGALQRFGLYVNNTAESGSNAGSNFAIRAYSDAGALLSTPFFINRATGNVGIGTTAPTRKLQITDGEVYVRFNPTAVAGNYILGAADGRFYVIPEATFVPTMTFNSGNVLIGTTTDNGYRLNVSGITNVSAGAITAGSETTYAFRVLQGKPLTLGADDNYAYIQSWSSGPLVINGQGNNVLFSNASTNVLIGTTTDSGEKMTVYGASEGAMIFQNSTSGTGAGNGLYLGTLNAENYLWTYEAQPLIFGTNNNEQVRITSAGHLGVNSAASSVFVLDVSSTDTAYNTRLYQPSTATDTYVSLILSGAMTSAIGYMGTGGSTAGNVAFRDNVVVGSQSNHPLVFNTNDAERGRFTAGGNLLIGTTTDAGYKLDVNGVAAFRGAGAAGYGTINAISTDSFIRLNTTGGTADKQKWDIRAISATGFESLEFRTVNDANNAFSTKMFINYGGQIRFNSYGSGSFTGTTAYALSVDSSGNVIESASPLNATSLYDLLPAGRVAYNWIGQVVNDTWTTVFTKNDNILTTGTWMVKMYVNDFGVGGGHYQYVYSGIMTWDQGTVNQTGEAAFSEVYLHRMGHAANASILYLRTAESGAAGGNIGYFQIKGNYSNTSNQTIQFQFVKIF